MSDAAHIRALNDAFRCGNRRAPDFVTSLVITSGVAAFGAKFVDAAMAAVVNYDDFTDDNGATRPALRCH